MSWRDRAVKVEIAEETPKSGWKSRAQPVEEESTYWGDVGKNAIRQAKAAPAATAQAVEAISRFADVTESALKFPIQRAMGIPTAETAIGQRIQMGANMPKSVIEGLIDTAQRFASPRESFRKEPLTMGLDVATVATPFVKGAFTLAKGAPAAAEAAARSAAPGIAKKVFAKTTNTVFGVPEDAALARMQNPGAVKTAFAHSELADQMTGSMNNLREKIGDLDSIAKEKLTTSPYLEDGAIPKATVQKTVQSARKALGGLFSLDAAAAAKALSRVRDSYKKLKSTVSESQVKDLIQQLDADIDWSNPAASKTNKALVDVRTRLDDILKKQNTAYREAMGPVQEAINTRDKMEMAFGFKKELGRGYVPTDQTVGKLQRALREDKLQTQDILSRFEKATGEDWRTKMSNSNAKASFEGAGIHGARRTMAGFGTGELVGNIVGLPPAMGAALGTLTGAFADVYGKATAAKIIDALANPAFSRYADVLKQAASRGARNLVATQALLMEQDPEYRKAIGANTSKAPAKSQ